jgi:3-oxoacyl-[acyl-carrier protein] reductase
MILITGANGGIGQHILRYLLSHGERQIVCHYRGNHESIKNTLREFGLDIAHHAYQADLTEEHSVQSMAERINAEHGMVTRLVNVAGSSSNGMSWKLSKDDFTRVLENNLVTTFLCCKHFVPTMRENRFGRIINFSSIVGFSGIAGAAHYAAAKAGLVGFTKSLALELAGHGITANAVALGYFNTGMINSVPETMQDEIRKKIPVGRFGELEDVGGAVSYLIGKDSSFMTGQVLHLNGGQF